MEQRRRKIQAFTRDDLPGYYAPEDDIMIRAKRVEGNLDDEVLNAEKTRPAHVPIPSSDINTAEVTPEDLEALGPKDLSMDMGDDEELKHRTTPVDFTGKDLDIPGAELDDEREAVGSEDEENNSYSLGGENHEDLEEPRP